MNLKKLIVWALAAVALAACEDTKTSNEVFITPHGKRYHHNWCRTIQDHSVTSLSLESAENIHAADIICACWNNLDISIIEPYLSEDVIWKGKVHSGALNDATLAIGSPITVKGKRNYLEYLEKWFLKRNHVNPEWLEEYAISLSKSMLKNVCKYKRMEIEYLQEELRRFVCEERHNEVMPLEAWQEYKRSMEKPLSLNSELMKKMLGMHPELKYLVGDIDDCQQENAEALVQGEDPDATIFIEKFFQTDNNVPF